MRASSGGDCHGNGGSARLRRPAATLLPVRRRGARRSPGRAPCRRRSATRPPPRAGALGPRRGEQERHACTRSATRASSRRGRRRRCGREHGRVVRGECGTQRGGCKLRWICPDKVLSVNNDHTRPNKEVGDAGGAKRAERQHAEAGAALPERAGGPPPPPPPGSKPKLKTSRATARRRRAAGRPPPKSGGASTMAKLRTTCCSGSRIVSMTYERGVRRAERDYRRVEPLLLLACVITSSTDVTGSWIETPDGGVNTEVSEV